MKYKVTGGSMESLEEKKKKRVREQEGWHVSAFGWGEKRKGCCCGDERRMKIEKQTNKLGSVWESGISETRGFCQVWCDRCSGLPLVSLAVWSRLRRSLCAAICLQQEWKKSTHALKKPQYKREGRLCLSFGLFASLFPYHVCCLSLSFFCLSSLSLLPFFFLSSTLYFSPNPCVPLRPTPRLAWFQASGYFNAPISLLFWVIQSERSTGGGK